MIQEASGHVFANEIAEDVDEGREKRFQRRAHGAHAVRLDRGGNVNVDTHRVRTRNDRRMRWSQLRG